MNAKTATARFEKAGAKVTKINLTENTERMVAKFPNGTICTYDPDWETGEVDAFAFPYAKDEANQTELCFFRHSVKSAIEKATRN
jgi:hypothetical protein